MLRFMLVLVNCALPVYSMASTYHADNRASDHLEITSKTAFRLFPYQWQPVTAATYENHLSHYDIWQPKIGLVFKATKKSVRKRPRHPQTPGLFHFKDRPYPPQFVPARINRIATSSQDDIPIVPIASSYVFMLTLMIAALIAQQKDNIRSAATYARLYLTFNKARNL